MKLRIQSIKMACLALFCTAFVSCNDDALLEAPIEASQNYACKFELTVDQSPKTRLELGEDGLTTQWEPGDKLVLVDKSRSLAPIFLNCTLTERSNTATFVAENGVPAGDYYVIYNYNENLAYGHKGFQSVNDINMNDDLVLWNELTIREGDDNASISLQHLYTKIRVVLENVYDPYGKGFEIGVYSSKKGFPAYKQFTSNGLVDAEYGYNPNSMNYTYDNTYFPSNRKYHNIRFGYYSPTYIWDESTYTSSYDYSKAAECSALVLPADLRGEAIFFYIISNNTCYEFRKEGVELKAGTSYKVILDMNQATTVSTLEYSTINTGMASSGYQLANAADWRHAAYKNDLWNTYEITNNINFENEYFFPIATRGIWGEGHTLSNINLDWVNEDNVGLIRYEWDGRDDRRELRCVRPIEQISSVSDLKLENVTIKGNNFVGAFGGYNIAASRCEVIGNSTIEGQGNNIGGIVGFNKLYYSNGMNTDIKFDDVRVGQNCSVSGKNYVGGIVGRYATVDYSSSFSSSMILMESCKSEATVTASEDYVGGIFGKIGGSYRSSYETQTYISFSMEDYTFSLIKCVNEGGVTGRHYVGGIGGDFAISSNSGSSTLDRVVLSQSCSTGDVTGVSKVGGILGSTIAATNICYSTGEIKASDSTVGGIVGHITGGSQVRVANSYSLATISGTNTNIGGILGSNDAMDATIINCYYAADPATYSFGGIVGYSNGYTSVTNCLTTLSSLGTNLGDHEYFGPKRDWMDSDNDGVADYDYNHDGVIDNYDLYDGYMSRPDIVTNSIAAVTSILANRNIINGDNAYSSNYWDISLYPWYCVKFASFSADTNSPDYDEETIQ